MADPGERRAELEQALDLAASEARAFLAQLDRDSVQPSGSEQAVTQLGGALPEDGAGALPAISDLARLGHETATRSSGPRFFHFVIGGATPAALAADWLTSAFDQNAVAWVGLAARQPPRELCIDWLRDLFELPPEFGGVLATGATMANFTGLAVARDWCGRATRAAHRRTRGLASTPQIPVFSSGYIHAERDQVAGDARDRRRQRAQADAATRRAASTSPR